MSTTRETLQYHEMAVLDAEQNREAFLAREMERFEGAIDSIPAVQELLNAPSNLPDDATMAVLVRTNGDRIRNLAREVSDPGERRRMILASFREELHRWALGSKVNGAVEYGWSGEASAKAADRALQNAMGTVKAKRDEIWVVAREVASRARSTVSVFRELSGYDPELKDEAALPDIVAAAETAALHVIYLTSPHRAESAATKLAHLPESVVRHLHDLKGMIFAPTALARGEMSILLGLDQTVKKIRQDMDDALGPEQGGEAEAGELSAFRSESQDLVDRLGLVKAIQERVNEGAMTKASRTLDKLRAARDAGADKILAAIARLEDGFRDADSISRLHPVRGGKVHYMLRTCEDKKRALIGKLAMAEVSGTMPSLDGPEGWEDLVKGMHAAADGAAREVLLMREQARSKIAACERYAPEANILMPSMRVPDEDLRLLSLRACLHLLFVGRGGPPENADSLLFGEGWEQFIEKIETTPRRRIPREAVLASAGAIGATSPAAFLGRDGVVVCHATPRLAASITREEWSDPRSIAGLRTAHRGWGGGRLEEGLVEYVAQPDWKWTPGHLDALRASVAAACRLVRENLNQEVSVDDESRVETPEPKARKKRQQ